MHFPQQHTGYKSKKSSLIVKITSLSIVAFGILCRLSQYLANRSFDIDEAGHGISYRMNSMLQLLQLGKVPPGARVTPAPYGFLIIQKLAAVSFGNNELVLRMFPLICGVMALLLFYKVKDLFVGRYAGLVAVSILAVSSPLIYFSSELKPYASDVFVTLLLYVWLDRIYHGDLRKSQIILFSLTGALSLWFSYPAVFILAGGGAAVMLHYISQKDSIRLKRFMGICLFLLLNILVYYWISLRNFAKDQIILEYWKHHMLSGSFQFSVVVPWVFSHFWEIFRFPLGLNMPVLGGLFFLLGCWSVLQRNAFQGMVLLFPFLLTIMASLCNKYPFSGRVLFFLTPSLAFLVAEGWEFISKKGKNTGKTRYLSLILLLILLAHPAWTAWKNFLKPIKKGEIRESMIYIKKHFKEGDDGIYVYWMAQVPFRYYKVRHGFRGRDIVTGHMAKYSEAEYLSELKELEKFKRVWVLLANTIEEDERRILFDFGHIGNQIDSYESPGSRCLLFEMRE